MFDYIFWETVFTPLALGLALAIDIHIIEKGYKFYVRFKNK